MELFLSLSKELRLEKVVALFDANVPTFSGLKDRFENGDIRFFQLQTEDIRDKVGCSVYWTGKLRQVHEMENVLR